MDLIIETKQYKLCYDRLKMSYIAVFLTNKSGKFVEIGDTRYLTKKETKELIEFIKQQDFDTEDSKDRFVEQLSNMEMLMEGKEKASFYFW